MPYNGYSQKNKDGKKAKQEQVKNGKPELKVDRTCHDFGKIEEGSNGETEFEIWNSGGGLLTVKDVKTSCGCVLVDYSTNALMHEEKGFVRVRYNTNIVGEIKRSIVVNTNDENNPKTVLYLIGEVVKKTER